MIYWKQHSIWKEKNANENLSLIVFCEDTNLGEYSLRHRGQKLSSQTLFPAR